MGLAEKKMINDVKENLFPGMINWITGFLGQEMPFDADYESFGNDFVGKGHMNSSAAFCDRVFRDFFSSIYDVTKDKIGKEAFLESVKEIYFQCHDGDLKIELEGTKLVVTAPYRDENFRPKSSQYQQAIEALL